jgi:hypothetical protein
MCYCNRYWTAGLKQITIVSLTAAAAVWNISALQKDKLFSKYFHNIVLLYHYPHITRKAIKSTGLRIQNLFQIMKIVL